jgi:hypothetical protein
VREVVMRRRVVVTMVGVGVCVAGVLGAEYCWKPYECTTRTTADLRDVPLGVDTGVIGRHSCSFRNHGWTDVPLRVVMTLWDDEGNEAEDVVHEVVVEPGGVWEIGGFPTAMAVRYEGEPRTVMLTAATFVYHGETGEELRMSGGITYLPVGKTRGR